MKDLNEVLKLNLSEVSIFEINEENLIALKSCDFYLKNTFYFWLINKIHAFENRKLSKELAYANYLMSYYILIILLPLSSEELAFYHIENALKHDDNLIYKEWILIFATLPKPFLKISDAIKIAEEVIEKNPNSNLANTVLQIF